MLDLSEHSQCGCERRNWEEKEKGQRLRHREKRADVDIVYSGHLIDLLKDWLKIVLLTQTTRSSVYSFMTLVVLQCDFLYAEAAEKKVFEHGSHVYQFLGWERKIIQASG